LLETINKWEAEIGRIEAGQGQIVQETPSPKQPDQNGLEE
jgi:hypothetical protein